MRSRRNFIRNMAGITIACCGMGMPGMLMGCAAPRYVQFSRSQGALQVKKSDFLDDSFVLITDAHLSAPIFILKKAPDEFKAFLMLCTHKGCDVKPAGSILLCPCHGSEFSQEGVVLKGPAEENLAEYELTTDEENVIIHLP